MPDAPASPEIPWPEYPRPQLVRPRWACLNGEWEFAFDDAGVGLEERWWDGRPLPAGPGRITVPFPYQSRLSGIGDTSVHEVVWYAREFKVPPDWSGDDVLLHFGAVDYLTTVWINGQEAAHNRGGHVPFSVDASPYLREAGSANRVVLRVEDRQDPHQPRGKQAVSAVPGGIDYHCSTGIWQTVWLEPAPQLRIDQLAITTDPEAETIEVRVTLHAPATGYELEATALATLESEQAVAQQRVAISGGGGAVRLRIPGVRLWSPEDPHLYGLRLRLLGAGGVLDEVTSYAGVRRIIVQDGRFFLNGRPLYLAMALDQGYWPDGLYTAPSEEALRADVEWARRLGFNGLRKHQKVENPRWLAWCDRLGVLVWGEMPNARAWSAEAEEMLVAEWERAVERDASHPCVVAWVPVNESMGFPGLEAGHPGQYTFLERVVALTRRLDPHRPVIDNDGWEHTDVTDVVAIHDYTPTGDGLRARYRETLEGGALPPTVWWRDKPLFLPGARYRGQPVMLTEVGGFLQRPPDGPAVSPGGPDGQVVAPGASADLDRLFDVYATVDGGDELLSRYADLLGGLSGLRFLAGFCYTQLYDVQQEVNGLLTYDRRPKADPRRVAELHARFLESVSAAGGVPAH